MTRRLPSPVHLAVVAVTAACPIALAQDWTVLRPSNTGVPGEEVLWAGFHPDGHLWVSARWPFWAEGGIGILDTQTGVWSNIWNRDTPLVSEFVNDFAVAPDGTEWFATGAGLVKRRNGTWTRYTTANSPLVNNWIFGLDIAPNGHVWLNNTDVQGVDAAIFEFDGSVWKKYRVGSELPWALPWVQLTGVEVTSDGHVWVTHGTLDGIAEYDQQTWTLRGDVLGQRFGGAFDDVQGNLWLPASVSAGNAFWKYSRATGQFTLFHDGNVPFSSLATAFARDAQGRVYVGTWHGQVARTADAGQSWQVLLDGLNIVTSVAVQPGTGDLWVGTLGAVGHFTPDGGALVRDYNTYNTGVPDYWVDRFARDPRGNMWFATGEAGLSRFDGQIWRNWGNHNAGAEPYPFAGNEPMGAFFMDSAGNGWMGGNGIARWDPATGQFTGFWNWQNNPGLGVTLFTHFAQAADGTLFAAEFEGRVYRFDGVQWVREPAVVWSVYESAFPGIQADNQGRVWAIGTVEAWLWDSGTWSPVAALANCGAITFHITPDGTVWIGSFEGLLRLQGQNLTLFSPATSPLPTRHVRGIDSRADGLLAVAGTDLSGPVPAPAAVALIDGDPANPANWTVHTSGVPFTVFEPTAVKFDAAGDLWTSFPGQGVAVLGLGAACYPDCNADGSLTVADFGCFQTRFVAQDPYADCNGDALLTVADFGCFQTKFVAGCP